MLQNLRIYVSGNPVRKYFTLCEQGRLLIIGEEIYSMKKFELTRQKALELNNFARWIADSTEKEWKITKT